MAQALRMRQTELTRTVILDALEDRLAEDDPLEFSVQEVADRAGLAHRTVYRHYPTREALLDALVHRLEERLIDRAYTVVTADDVPASVRHNFRFIEEFGRVVDPLIRLGVTTDLVSPHSQRRTESFLGALDEVTGHLDPETAHAVRWTIRQLASHQTWVRLRREGNIDGALSGEAVAWAIETLLDALRNGRGPTPRPHEGAVPGRGSDDAPDGLHDRGSPERARSI